MRTRSYRRKKRGVASVLGVLIMVGILMTSILPTFIYVNEVNNYYDRAVVELKIADKDRDYEDLEVYAYGHTDTEVDILIINRAPLATNITRIWVMNTTLQDAWIFNSTTFPESLPLYLSASEQVSLRMNFTGINEEGSSYKIEVATDRGNKFSSATNPLTYVSGDWQTGSMEFNIQVIVQSSQGNSRFLIKIYGPENHFDFVDSATVQGQFFSVFNVPQAGQYNVTVQNIHGGSSDYIYQNTSVILSWIFPDAFCQFDDSISYP
jgi:hypothetical protein